MGGGCGLAHNLRKYVAHKAKIRENRKALTERGRPRPRERLPKERSSEGWMKRSGTLAEPSDYDSWKGDLVPARLGRPATVQLQFGLDEAAEVLPAIIRTAVSRTGLSYGNFLLIEKHLDQDF